MKRFTRVEKLLVIIIIIILLAPIAVWFGTAWFAHARIDHAQVQARLDKARADSRSLASAVAIYKAHTDVLPETLAELTNVATNTRGVTAGPFLQAIPSAPSGRRPYLYEANSISGAFKITTSGDSMVQGMSGEEWHRG